MAYYLGYKTNDEYIPIDLDIDNSFDILSIVNYTTNFYEETDLIDNLLDVKKIPSDQVSLVYLIDKGKKGKKVYLPLPNTDKIYYNAQKKCFDIDTIQDYMLSRRDDQEFFRSLLYSTLKKYGIDQKIISFFRNQNEDYLTKIKFFKILIKESDFWHFNSVIDSLLQSLETGKNFSELLLSSFCELVANNRDILIYVYNRLKVYLNFPRTSETDKINLIINLLSNSNPYYEKINDLIKSFIETYIRSSSKNTINSRNVFDLGVFIQNYKEYLLQIEISKYSAPESDEYDDSDNEEFLEESDFTRCHTNSEESGVRLRRTDCSKWE